MDDRVSAPRRFFPIQKIFRINQRLDIILPDDKSFSERYASRIEEIHPDYLAIAMPMAKSVPVILLANDRFYGEMIDGGTMWQFTCTFLNKRIHPIPLWIVSPPYNIRKMQRREFVRFPAMLPVKISPFPNEELLPPVAYTSKDISAGGLLINSRSPFAMSQKVRLSCELPGFDSIEATGQVVRVEQPKHGLYWIGIRFLEIAEKDRNNIVKYIFRKQSEQRWKSLEWE